MKKYLVSFACLFFISVLDMQKIHYATRFRNFSTESETNSIYIINMTIFQYNMMEHRFNTDINVTKDVRSKAIHVVVNRCAFEKSACEYFQTWKFNENLKAIVYMKNQIWTPIFSSLTPRLDFPVVKKNIYRARNVTVNADAARLFYPDLSKYYWDADAMIIDTNDKKAVVLKFEFSFFEYVERNRKRRP